MANEKGLYISGGTVPGNVTNGNLRALRPADKLGPHQVCLAQDRVIGSGMRLVASTYMGNADAWLVPDSAGGSNLHPDTGTLRTALRTRAPLTPGHTLLVTYLAVPCGDTEEDPGMGGAYESSGPQGAVYARITWTNIAAETDTVTASQEIAGSAEANGAQPADDGESYTAMIRGQFEVHPDGLYDSNGTIEKWMRAGTVADILIQHLGGARIVSCSVWELPRVVAGEWEGDAPAAHLYTDEAGQPLGGYPLEYPADFASPFVLGDDRFGSERVTSTAHRISEILGPTVYTDSVYAEHAGDIDDVLDTANDPYTGDGEWEPAVSTSHTTFQLVWDLTQTGWDANYPALSIASGGHGRLYPSSGYPTSKHKVGTIRVRVGAWAKVGGGTGYVRVQTSRWSYVDIPITSTSYAWHEAEGHLECGRGAADRSDLRVYVQSPSAILTTSYRYSYATFLPDEV